MHPYARVSPNTYSVPMTIKRKGSPKATTAVLYCRVSATDAQSDSTTSLEGQERTLRAAALAHGYTDVHVVIERHTAAKRLPELALALDALDAGRYAALYVAKIDRLSRSGAADVLRIADRSAARSWRLVALDMALDTGTIVGRLVLTILAGVAEMESGRRKERMREYHAERAAQGQRTGVDYGQRPLAVDIELDAIRTGRQSGQSWASLAQHLTEISPTGRTWHSTAVRRTYATIERSTAA